MDTLCDILDRLRSADRDDLLWARPTREADFAAWSATRFLKQIGSCAAGLRARGVGRGDRVGFICANRPEWHVLDFACHGLGAVLVPLFPTLAAAQVRYCFASAGCRAIVVDDLEQLAKVGSVASELPELEWVALLEGDAAAIECASRDRLAWDDLLSAPVADDLPGPESPDDLATIIFTSGTTGPPKGVMLTHRNFVANIAGTLGRTPPDPTDTGLSLLPLNHVYERTIDYCYLAAGASIAYSAPDRVSVDFKAIRPTIMVGVPRLYEKLRSVIEARIEESGPVARGLYERARAVALRRARARHGVETDTFLNRLKFSILNRLVLDKVRDVMGGRIRMLSAGGAALDPELNWWFAAMGWDLLQGYGLTESAPIISTNTLADNRIGTVGPPLANVEVRIAEDGEVLARGPNMTPGYWNDPEATAATFVDDWLATGDIGEIDGDGFLRITDRKKALLVTSTGKNVAPQPIENALRNSPFIEQVMVVGDDRRFVAALIVPDTERLARWCGKRGLPTEVASMCEHREVHELFEDEMSRVQADFARYERARAFRLLQEAFTVENGRLTPTLKTVRRAVERDYAALIEEIYAG